jgi:hypothetical protein
MMNNQPVVGANAKIIRFEFPHPKLGDYPEQTAKVEFALDKMVFEGKPSF